MKHYQAFIDGSWVDGKLGQREIINPATSEPFALITECDSRQVDNAVQSAALFLKQPPLSIQQRKELLNKLAEQLEKNTDEFARLESINTGKPLREAVLDVNDSVSCLRYYSGILPEKLFEQMLMADGSLSSLYREPIGVCGLIVPWNFPLLLSIWKIAPALAGGNAVIIKPAEDTPITLCRFTEIIDDLQLPKGLFQLLTGSGEQVGEALVNHPTVRKISFTGSTRIGKQIYAKAAGKLKNLSLELGGKNPLLIFADADLESAVDLALFGAFFNNGQVCVSSSRLLVQSSIYEDFCNLLITRTQQLRIGDPMDISTEIGPLINERQLYQVLNYIDIGLKEGAKLRCGGKRISKAGYYIEPAVFTDVHQQMSIVQEEIFGPVVTVQAFNQEEEAIELANDTPYGLAAGIITQNIERAKSISRYLEAGTIWINTYHTPYVQMAWGGMKASGIGRELGPQGLESFTELKHVSLVPHVSPAGWFVKREL